MINQLNLPDSVRSVLGNRALTMENAGCSGAFVAYAGDDLVLKRDAAGSLNGACKMQGFLSSFGLSPESVYYESGEFDYLISRRVPGESAISNGHLSDPKRLAHALGGIARKLHEIPLKGCPVRGLADGWKQNVEALINGNSFDPDYVGFLGIRSREEAASLFRKYASLFRNECVIHGDLCLPNYMLSDFSFRALIDVGAAGVGDRHYDLFWTLWSMWFNLKTDAWSDAFLSAYGKQDVNWDLIRAAGAMCALGG